VTAIYWTARGDHAEDLELLPETSETGTKVEAPLYGSTSNGTLEAVKAMDVPWCGRARIGKSALTA
jgi:hypothetical protein